MDGKKTWADNSSIFKELLNMTDEEIETHKEQGII